MKKLDDLVFKNLHGLKDEDDQAKHKHDNKSLDNFSSDPQQQQQQMMYNYYNNNYANNMAPQQYGNQAGMNQGFMQNMQHQQGMNQANMGGMGNQNAYGMQQMNQLSQGNWNNTAQNQMQTGNKIPNILHPSQNPNFAQMNPMMQKQYVQMYQMAQLQMQQMKQAQNAFPNQGSFQNQQNTGNIQNTQQQYYQQSGGMGLNQGINQGFPSYGNPPAKQPSQGFNNFGSFPSNQNTNAQFDDDFADFQTNTNSGTSNQNMNKNQADDFDDFQDASVTKGKANNNQQQFDEGFDDFQDASVTTAPQSTANEPKNWDILDDFVEKKQPTQPQAAQNPAPQQTYGNMQNLSAQQAQYLRNQAMYQNQMFIQQQQQQNFAGTQQSTNANDNDDFEDFEEAKPSQVTKPKSPTKEDLMFGALESKAIKHMGLENIISHPIPTPIDDFGDFGAFNATNTGNVQPQNQNFGGDDFQDFEDAGPTKPQEITSNPPPGQEHKKLTIYDIDLAEFGITETTQGPHLTEPIKDQALPEPPTQQQQRHEDFGDFVEINEEKPSQSFGFGAPQNQNQLNFGYSNNETDKKADADEWGFASPPEPATNFDHNDFGDFEEPQIAAPQTNQPAADAFDDFQEVAAPNQKEIGKSWEHIDFPQVESQPKETHDAGDFGDFEEHTSAPVQQAKAEEEFGDFDFPVPATQNQETLFEEFTSTPAPPVHTQTLTPTEEKQNPNAFDDFEEFSSPAENPKVEVEEAKKVEEEHGDDDFGDFGEQDKPQKEAEPGQKMQIEETTTSNPKQQVEKKLSVYDMDWAEFGIEDKNQNAPPPMQFHFGAGFEDKSGQDEKKTPVSGGHALTDLYSLYGNTNVTTPVAAAEQGGEAQGVVIQEEKQEDQDDFDDFDKPKPAADEAHHENDGFDGFEAAPKKDDDGFAFDNQNQDHGNDDFADFGDFGAAPQESKPQNQAFEDPFFFHQQEPQQHKEENLFGDFSSHANEVVSPKIQEEHHDDGFGGFEHGSQDGAHHQDDFSDFQEPKQANPVEEQHEDDGFDDFADAGHTHKKQDEVETPVKSLSQIGGAGLYHDNSDYGSITEVPHHQQPSAQNNLAETHDFNFKKKTSPTREDAFGKRAHDDFGSFNDADHADNQSREAPEPDHHHKDESIFHRADSSDYTPQNKKDESAENDDFGDFVGSKQDLPKEEAEAERVPPSPPRENFSYTLESVLGEYGIKAGQETYAEKQEKNPLEEEIEKRIEEITQEFEEKLVKSTLLRAAVKKEKFKLNAEMVEELAQELKSLQKYKEAILTEGQTKIIAEIKELNQTKARLIDEDELEEAVRYKDLVKNKEKEQIPKQKFEEFLSYYDNPERKDYRLALLEELRAANVPNQYINYFYIRFLGRAILPEKEVVAQEPLVEETPVQPAEDQPVVIQEDDEQKEILESNENKDEVQTEEQQPLEAEKEEAQVEKVETENQPEEEHVEKNDEEQNGQVDEKPSEEVKDDFDDFGQAEEAEEKKDEQPETNEEPENQPENVAEDVQDNTTEAKQQDEFEDFGESEPAQKQDDENNGTEKVEPEFEENQGGKEENNQIDDQPQVEEKQEEPEGKSEENKPQEEEGGFGDFDQPETTQKPEEGEEKDEEIKPQEEQQKEEEDGGFGDFDQPETTQKPEEGEEKDEEIKPQDKQDQDDGFGDFDQPEVEKKSEDNNKFEDGEEKGEEESKPQEDGFGDFDDQTEVAKKPEDNNDFKFDEEKDKNENDEFENFDDQPQTAQKAEDDFKFDDGEEKEEEESKPQAQEEEQHREDDDGFGDFDDQPGVAKKTENNDDFKFDDDKEEKDEFEDFSKPEEAKQEAQEEQQKEDDDGFGDFGNQPQAAQKAGDDFKFDDGEEEKEEESKPQVQEEEQHKEDDDDGFGDFDDQPRVAKKTENNDDFKFDDDKEEKDEFEGFNKPEEAKPEVQDDFGDFDKPAEVVHEEEETQEELKLEDIQTEQVPLTLEGLEEQKRRITQWSLMVKVMFAENINFNNNVRKILKQIIYEIYKFNKMTTAILQEKNKDAARAILSSQKFENYVAGVQILQAFCSELQTAFQFIEFGNKWFNKYYKAIEDLTQKVDGLKNQIREEFNKEFPAQVLTQENSKSAEWLGEIQKLDKEALRHICHLSLRLNDSQLTEYSGNYYFLPYLNFLLNIE